MIYIVVRGYSENLIDYSMNIRVFKDCFMICYHILTIASYLFGGIMSNDQISFNLLNVYNVHQDIRYGLRRMEIISYKICEILSIELVVWTKLSTISKVLCTTVPCWHMDQLNNYLNNLCLRLFFFHVCFNLTT